MDIMVEGKGKRFYSPDEVEITLNFYTKSDTYEKALEEGTKDVQIFIEKVIEQMNFSRADLKTRSFRLYEEKKYDYEKKIEIKYGFAYTQNATLKFNYDIKVVSEFMERASKLNNPPKYTIGFSIKNMQQSKNEVLADAYNMAKEKAEAIAKAAGKTLKECVKTDFRAFEERVYTRSSFSSALYEESADYRINTKTSNMTVQDTITNIFTPEDVEISETLYCLWITE